ncbi:lipopolysaccharide biosynthesis protein [Lysinibacillus sp. LZ02]|uniref:lipopolysaccharide biosynthesis protein n=1 Tax=Lysinibacillus sp. LZ02 TaxID=3420668 RepID=UPI003D360897
MNYKITKSRVIYSFVWKFLESIGTQGIQLIVMIILTRLLLPEEFGLLTLVVIFISIAALLVESGFNTALIQNKNTDEIDFSSVFYLNLIIASILYIVLFFTAPLIATFFEAPQVILVVRILSITLFFTAFNSVQYAIIARNMQFEKFFKSSLLAVFISGIIGISMAYADCGIWALVGQQLTSQFLVTVILWFTVNWRPKLIFSLKSVSQLYSFGWKLVASTLIYTFYTNIQSLVIGKMFSSAMLGFYSRGMQLPNILVSNINGSIQSVMFPALASQQDNINRVKEMSRRVIVTSSFIIFPLMVGLAVIAEPLVKIIFTEKWLPSVPFLQIFCGYYALWTIDATNLHVIKALGRSDIFLKLEILKFLIGILILIMTIPYGVYVIALGVLINRIITTILDAFPNKYLINYSFMEQLKDTIPSILLSLVMGVTVYSIQWLELSDILTILIQIGIGIVIYISLAKLFKVECFVYLVFSIKNMLRSKKGKINWSNLREEEV